MGSAGAGQFPGMDEHAPAGDPAAAPQDAQHGAEPQVTATLDGDVSCVTVVGELTEAARRPLVRAVTDQLLSTPTLHRLELQLSGVTFMNSAGMAVLVQLQRMTQPRAVTVALVEPPPTVARPLQLTGLWRRFEVVDDSDGPAGAGGSPPSGAQPRPDGPGGRSA
ncbi:stage II sporulation protein AA (anti-sigma F factor antagonist) [Geodermatophilus telluris]|uniref:Anti-sigma factor antagonist n=1 Tax=Geodermatophilus telluris TaxID=1190417 RepID=A0A1G6P3Y2_9ACTN|nr:STAS domain-containing protein [Geodermatophilus telluris]SDC74314.1 stage II sporulation protein AA (anti-sigma F factor antagonist) [Geodermatophilus telluris]